MMNSRMRIGGAVLLLGMAIGAQAQITKVGSKYQFRIKYTKGATISQNVTISTSLNMGGPGKPATPMVMAIPTKMKCTGVKGDVYTVAVTSGPMTMGGKPFNNSKAQTTTVKVNSKGKMMEGAPTGSSFGNVEMPDKPLAVNDTWSGTINMPGGQGKVNAKYKFKGMQTIAGKQVAVIGVTMTMDGAMGKMTGTGTMNLLTSDGQPLNMNMNMAGSINTGAATGGSGSGMKMSMAIKMVRA